MPPLGVGLIGLGRHGMRYARHLLDEVPEGRLVAVSRRNESDGAQFGEKHRVGFYRDYRDLIADPAVEVVVAVTPPIVSRAICLDAVRAKKAILIEKPLAPTASAAREMVEAARSAAVPLMTAHTLRFDATIESLKSRIATSDSGQYFVMTSRVEPSSAGAMHPDEYGGRGVLLEVGIHLLDLVRFLTEDEVVEVSCEMERAGDCGPDRRASATVHTARGLTSLLDVSRVGAGRVGRVEWIGREEQLLADWIQRRVRRLSANGSVEEEDVAARPTVVATLRAFLDAVRRGLPMPISGLDGLRAVELADACYRSADEGKPIKLNYDREA